MKASEILARKVQKAQSIIEESWDFEKKGYRIDEEEAATIACADEPDLIFPVYLLIRWNWNDANDWAERVLYTSDAALKA